MASISQTGIRRKKRYAEEKTVVFDVELSATTDESYPHISYAELYKAKTGKYPGKLGTDQFPTELNELDRRWLDDLQDQDIGDGYDEGDSFIDNTDLYDDKLPMHVTTKYGGFYVNCGVLKLKESKPEVITKAVVEGKNSYQNGVSKKSTDVRELDKQPQAKGTTQMSFQKSGSSKGIKEQKNVALGKRFLGSLYSSSSSSSPNAAVAQHRPASATADQARPISSNAASCIVLNSSDDDDDDQVLSRLVSSTTTSIKKINGIGHSPSSKKPKPDSGKPVGMPKVKKVTKKSNDSGRQHSLTHSGSGACSPIVKQANRVVKKSIKAKLQSQNIARGINLDLADVKNSKPASHAPNSSHSVATVKSSPSPCPGAEVSGKPSAPLQTLPSSLQTAVDAFAAEAKVRVAMQRVVDVEQNGLNVNGALPNVAPPPVGKLSSSTKIKTDLFNPRLDDLLLRIVTESRKYPSATRQAAMNFISNMLPINKKQLQSKIARIIDSHQRKQLDDPISKFMKAVATRSSVTPKFDDELRFLLSDIIALRIQHYHAQLSHRSSLGAFLRSYCEKELGPLLLKCSVTNGMTASAVEDVLVNELRILFPDVQLPSVSLSPSSPAGNGPRVSPADSNSCQEEGNHGRSCYPSNNISNNNATNNNNNKTSACLTSNEKKDNAVGVRQSSTSVWPSTVNKQAVPPSFTETPGNAHSSSFQPIMPKESLVKNTAASRGPGENAVQLSSSSRQQPSAALSVQQKSQQMNQSDTSASGYQTVLSNSSLPLYMLPNTNNLRYPQPESTASSSAALVGLSLPEMAASLVAASDNFDSELSANIYRAYQQIQECQFSANKQ